MANEPLDALNESDLVERRRWSGGTKVYSRKNKGRRGSNSSLASVSETLTVSANDDEVSKGIEISNSEGLEEVKQATLVVEAPGKGEENCYRLGNEEEVGGGEVSVSNTNEGLVDVSKEVIVPSEDGVVETVGEEMDIDQLGKEAGDIPGEIEARQSKDVAVTSEVVSRIELEEGSAQPIEEVVPDDKLSQEVGDIRGDDEDQSGKEAQLSSRDDEQLQSEDAPIRVDDEQLQSEDAPIRGDDEQLQSEDAPIRGDDEQLQSEDAPIRGDDGGLGKNDGLSGHEEGITHVETLMESDDVLPENRVALDPQEDSGRIGQKGGASAGETVQTNDDDTLEIREVVVPQHSSGGDVADENGVANQNEPQVELHHHPSVMTRVDDKLRINLSGARSSDEIRGVKRKLETELDQVQSLFKRLHSMELQITASANNGVIGNAETIHTNNFNGSVSTYGDAAPNYHSYIPPQYALNDTVERTLTRVSSEVGSVLHRNKLFNRSLSVSVVDNNHGAGEFVEREKRTPKANQLYRNSEFLLGKDRLPPESNKKLKSNGTGFASDKYRDRAFKSCNTLLQRLMKHNFGWVFNEPVDAKKLLLHDYHDIIKYPMDLGTIKNRLSQRFYKSPIEFAEDVRLVFHNAMTYNPKGHDVHVMAETLLNIFEERWVVIETEYNTDWRHPMYQDAGFPTPTSRKIPATQFFTPAQVPAPVLAPAHEPAPVYTSVTPVPQTMTLENSQVMTNTAPIVKPLHNVGRTPAPKKPKARDPNKRDMTYDEKQKLSTNLQNLPSEKLDSIVQIIKKRNSTLSQHNDEIEVDIDSVDAETLWELDRYVTNYKKSLSKNKRKAEQLAALQTRGGVVQTTSMMNTVVGAVEMHKETRIGENNDPSVQVEKQGDHANRSSSSSSSSSDSGTSSSDSDSDSSSSSRSDSGHSPRT